MEYCKRCGGTGQTVNGKFCNCSEGRLKKALEDGRAKAAVKKALEKTAQDLQKQAQEITPDNPRGKARSKPKKAEVEPLGLLVADDEVNLNNRDKKALNELFIDLALLTNDKNWFNELMKK